MAIARCEIHLGRTRVDANSAVLFAFLLYLTVRTGKPPLRDEILDLLWPGVDERSRRHALRQLLYRVRREGVPITINAGVIVFDRSAVVSDLDCVLADGWARSVAVEDIPSPRTILPAYRPALGAAFDAWLDGVRDEVAARIRQACLRHISTGRREGRWHDVESLARTCLVCDPLNEDATLALAEATAMAGAQAESLRILDAYLWELGAQNGNSGNAPKLLRRRISSQPHFRLLRSGEPALVGRAEELRWLNERRDSVSHGSPATTMLIGPPGIGKTATARAFTGFAEMQGWQVAVSRLQPTDGDRPMSLFLELLPRLLNAEGALGAAPESIAQLRALLGVRTEGNDPAAGAASEPEAIQSRIRVSALDLLGAVTHEGPLVLLLEDLHWIDTSSLRLLAWLVDHATELPVMWLFTSRMESHFATLRDVFPADRVPSLTIGPLGPDESVELFKAFAPTARHNAEIAQLAFTATGGNPLFIREVAGHWTSTGDQRLPSNLRSLMSERVARLSPPSQRVLHCCAILGRLATVPRVAAVLEVTTVELLDAIEELDGLGLVGVGSAPGSLALHDLWQEQVTSEMKAGSRALLHLRSGEILEAEAQADHSAATVVDAARHLISAGVHNRAIRLLCESAEHQLANGLTDDAVTTSAHGWTVAKDPADTSRCRNVYLRALHQAGRWSDILAVGPALRPDVQSDAHVPHDFAELLVIEALWRTGKALVFAAERALHCSENDMASDEHRLRACVIAAQAGSNLCDADMLKRAHAAAARISRPTPDLQAVGLAVELIYETELGSLDAALLLSDALIDMRRHTGGPGALTRALRFACYPRRYLGERDQALALSVEAYELAARYQLAEQAAHAADVCATIELEREHLAASESWLHRSETWSGRVSLAYMRRSRIFLRAHLALARNNHAEAARLLDLVASEQSIAITRDALELLSLQCRVLIAQERIDGIREPADRLARTLERSRSFFKQDAYVDAYLAAQVILGNVAAAQSYARRYRDEWRRDRSDLPDSIAAMAATESRAAS